MTVAVVAVAVSILLGTGIGVLSGSTQRAAGPFHTFAMVTAVAVVLGQLLPEALGALGVSALLAFGAGYLAPRVAERLSLRLSRTPCEHPDAVCTDLGLEVGYFGLLLHRVGDGIGLGVFAGPAHASHAHYDVVLAIAGHTVPVTALVVLAFRTHRGLGSALWRVVGMLAATFAGLVIAGSLPPAQLGTWEPWLTAAVGGMLLHIVTHGWPEVAQPTGKSRLMDLLALAAGVGLVALGGHSHAAEDGGPDMRHAMADALAELSLETAPMLLLGLLVAALLQTQGPRIPLRWLSGGGQLRQALRGAVMGAPLPVCACGILPVAHSLRARGAAAAVVVAFLLSTPELGVETFVLTVRFLGWEMAWVRLFGALLVAVVAAWLVARFAGERGSDSADRTGHGCGDAECGLFERPAPAAALPRRVLGHLDDLVYHIGAWTLLGLLAAAYVQAALDDRALSAIAGTGLDIVLLSLLAVPSYVCAASATPLAAVLMAKGISAGAVLAALLLGPATNLATVAWLRHAYGGRATVYGLIGLVASTWLLALAVNWGLGDVRAELSALHEHEHGFLAYASAVLLGLLFLRAIWRTGLRSWLGSLGEGFAMGGASHAHGEHAHG